MSEIKTWEIRHRISNDVLYTSEGESLKAAVLNAKRDLANLNYANLNYANLRYTNLRYAYLRYADLRYAGNLSKYLTTNLYMLLDQPGKIRAYKLVNDKNEGPFNGGVKYAIGNSIEVSSANTDESVDCGAGINLATLDWCMREFVPGYKILVCEFESKDIAAIPIGSDGKFRVHRCTVVREKDLKELGWCDDKNIS